MPESETTAATRIESSGNMIILLTWDPRSLRDTWDGYRAHFEGRLKAAFPLADLWIKESRGDRCSDIYMEIIDGPAEGTPERALIDELLDDLGERFFM